MMQFRPAAEARLGWLKQSKTRYSLSRCALRLDEKKAASNFIKHGLSFEEAATVFGESLSDTLPDPDHSLEEHRFVIIGSSESSKILVVAHTDDGES
jgi:uncharacterized DUF497 family protein